MDNGIVTIVTSAIAAVAAICVAFASRGRGQRAGLTVPLPPEASPVTQERDVATLTAASQGHAHNTADTMSALARTQVDVIETIVLLVAKVGGLEEAKRTADARFTAARRSGLAWKRRAALLEVWGRDSEEPVPRVVPPWETIEDLAAATIPFPDEDQAAS